VIQANLTRKFTLLILFLSMLPTTAALAGARHFTFLYEAPTSAPGSVELENTITWARTTDCAARLDEVGFREELEIGIMDHFQLGLYPLDWSYHNANNSDDNGFSYNGGAVELIYNLSNPVVDPAGISVYQEISGGRQHFELESKLIVQKNFGPLILDYNLTLEARANCNRRLAQVTNFRRESQSVLNSYTNLFSRIGATKKKSGMSL
jgi:hypothetical protein